MTIAALVAAVATPLTAAANPSMGAGGGGGGSVSGSRGMSPGGGGQHVWSGGQQAWGGSGFGGNRPAGAGTLARPEGGNPSMHAPQFSAPDRKHHHRQEVVPNYDWTWFNSQPQCNAAMWMHPELATNVYGSTTASCWWQNTPLWIP